MTPRTVPQDYTFVVREELRTEIIAERTTLPERYRHLLDEKFFSILNTCYIKYLEPFNSGFGTHTVMDEKAYRAYKDAWVEYAAQVTCDTNEWVRESLLQWAACEEETAILRNFRCKVWWILSARLFWADSLRPKLTTRDPLLCSAALMDRKEMVLQNQSWLAVVATWCEPLMIHVLTTMRTAKPFLSVSGGLLLWLHNILGDDARAESTANQVRILM